MKKIKLGMIALVALGLFTLAVYAQSNNQLQSNKAKQKAGSVQATDRLEPVSILESSGLKVPFQEYKMVTDVIDAFGGALESNDYRILVSSGGQPSPIGISESDNYTLKGGYVYAFETLPPCQDVALHSGWQWVSTNVDPYPCKMESIFVNCWSDLDIVIACDGSFCIPGVGCWIDCWKIPEMYKVHMRDTCSIQICGSKVPANKPIPLPVGWNCIAYFPECPLEPEFALASIWSKLNIVKNDEGQFCIPGIGCWIECLEQSEGYKVNLSALDTLIYPTTCPPCPPPFAKKNNFSGFAKTSHFNYSRNTGESYSIVVNSVELNGKNPEIGDEIGVFTPSGLCAGAGVWQGEILGISVWQDDDRTEAIDGFQVGEEMIFKLWDKSENKEIEFSANFEKGDSKFGSDAYAIVKGKGNTFLKGVSSPLPEKFGLAENYPNPFNPETEISYALPKDSHVKLTIYNLLGQKIRILVNEHQIAGYKRVHWDGKDDKGMDVASGIYFFRLEAGEFSSAKKMIMLK